MRKTFFLSLGRANTLAFFNAKPHHCVEHHFLWSTSFDKPVPHREDPLLLLGSQMVGISKQTLATI